MVKKIKELKFFGYTPANAGLTALIFEIDTKEAGLLIPYHIYQLHYYDVLFKTDIIIQHYDDKRMKLSMKDMDDSWTNFYIFKKLCFTVPDSNTEGRLTIYTMDKEEISKREKFDYTFCLDQV